MNENGANARDRLFFFFIKVLGPSVFLKNN